ncbi:hypothetical protein PFISCL1PPCAC_13710, partial [Pristionchus fissidentatus]
PGPFLEVRSQSLVVQSQMSSSSSSSSTFNSEISGVDGASSSSSCSLQQKLKSAAAAGTTDPYEVSLSSFGSSVQSEQPHLFNEARKRRLEDDPCSNEDMAGASGSEAGSEAGFGSGSPRAALRNRCHTAPEPRQLNRSQLGLSGSLEENGEGMADPEELREMPEEEEKRSTNDEKEKEEESDKEDGEFSEHVITL